MEDSQPSDDRGPETDSRSPRECDASGRSTTVIEVKSFEALTTEDLSFLVSGVHALRTGQTSQAVLLAIASGRGHLLRIVGKAQGIITGSIVIHPSGKEFQMGIFAGKGIFPSQIGPLSEAVFEWARGEGCRWVRFENVHPVLDRYYSRKFKREASVFVKEISNGQ